MSNRKAQAGRFNRGASFAFALFVFILCTTAVVMVANAFSWGSGSGTAGATLQSSQQAALPGSQASAAGGQLMQQGDLAVGDGASMVATRSSGASLQTARMDPGNGSTLTPLAEEPAIQDDSVENEPSQDDAVLEDQYEGQDQGDTYVEDEGSDDQAELTEQIDERIIETSLQCVDGHIYVVRISYDDFANIPEGSQLKLVELNQSLTREEAADPANRNRPYETERFVSQTDLLKRGEVLDKYLELQEGDWRYAAKYLDVKLVDANGEEVKPAAPVEMTIETTFLPVQQGGTLELAWQFPVTNPTPEDPYAYERMELDDKTDEVSTKVSFLTDHFGELAVAGVARTVNTWDVEGTKVYLLGAKTYKSLDFQGIEVDSGKEGWETREAFVVNVDPAPWYGTTMWLSAKPAEASSEGLGFLRGFRVRDGVLAGKIFAQGGTTEPVAFRADEEGFAFVWDTGYRRQALGVGNVTVEGMMPQGTELTAKGMRSAFPDPTELNEGLTAQAEDEGVELATAAAYDISLASAGQDYQPGEGTPVTVSITSVNINEGGSYQVWHVLDDGTVEVVEGATVVGNTITFEATGFSVYLVVSTTTLTKTLTASDGNTYQVSVTYEGNAGIPADVELDVREIVQGDDGYDEYVAASANALGEAPENLALARAFDITLRNPQTGEEYQPTKDVQVSIELLDNTLSDYENVNVVHIPSAAGEETQVMDSVVYGESVEFMTSGFSIYVLTGEPPSQPSQYVFEFKVWNDTVGNYVPYGSRQNVKSGEMPVIPMPPSDDSQEFVGWYEEASEGVLEDEPFDFEAFAEAGFTENGVKTLFARFTDFAYVVFHDQYDDATDTWPIAFTRRAELKEDPDTHETCAWVQIDDLTATYSGSQSMAFCGWSTTEIKTPGTYKNPDTSEDYAISWPDGDQHSGMIRVTEAGVTPLYPIYRSIHYLTYYTAQSGLGAEYVPPVDVFDGEGLNTLPVPTRDGYEFQGWYTGTLLISTVGGKTIEEVSFSKQVTGETGSLFNGSSMYLDTPDGGVYPQAGKLKLSANATLYAKWKAQYNVAIWVQSPSDDPYDKPEKTYEYYDTRTYEAEVGTTVAVSDECKNLSINGYAYSHDDGEKIIGNTKDVTVLNAYYNLTGPYSVDTGSYSLTFLDSVTGPAASEMPHAYDGTDGYERIEAGTKLENISVGSPSDRTSNGHVIYKFQGWYMDQTCTVPADLSNMTMPDRNLTLYAGWSAEWFIVNIDPSYGALYYYDGGELKGTGSTWFWQTYDSEPIGEYSHTTRDYVPSGSGNYYYVNRDRAYYGYSGNEWDNNEKHRETFYTSNISEATEDTTFEYAPGTYSYLGWYEVYANGTEADATYDFTQKTDHDTTLRLRWKKSGNYYLAFDAGTGTLDSSSGAKKDTVSQLTDCYADYSEITMNRVAVPSNNSLSFVGWRVKDDDTGPIYALGETFTLHAGDAVRESGRDVVWLEAVYAGKQTVTVVYDANGGTITADAVNYGSIPNGTSEPEQIADKNKSVDAENGTVTVLGLANNSSYTLSSGAGFVWSGRAPLGWSNVPVYDPSDPEAEFYTPGETYGVDVNGGSTTTLYAVWGVKVTYSLGDNEDASWNPAKWDSDLYVKDETHNAYTCVSYLGWNETSHSMVGIPVSEPVDIPNSGTGNSMFYYWTDGTPDNQNEYVPFDFTQPVTEDKGLFAVWDGAIKVPVMVINASNETLATSTAGNIPVQTEEVSLDNWANYFKPDPVSPEDPVYHYAFAVALNEEPTRENVYEADAITSVYYSQENKHLYLKYKDGRADTWLDEDTKLYFVYYQEEALDIGYRSMDTRGILTSVSDDTRTSLLGEYNMAGIELKGFDSHNYSHYAYALGSKDAENASDLRLITETYAHDDIITPVLRVKKTWNGFCYTTQTGDDAVWYDGGFDPQLYTVYFERKPTVVMIHEETIGTEAVMDTAFTYHIVITQTEKTGDTMTPPATIYDSDAVDDGNGSTVVHEYKLRSGEAQSAVLYYSNDGTTETTQTITVTQETDSSFTTKIGPVEMNSWSYTSTADGTLRDVTFTNRHNMLPVDVHVALLEDDGTVRNMDSTLRSDSHSIDVGLGETKGFLDNLPSSTVFIGDMGTYAMGAILCGSETTDGVITAAEMGVNSISYGQVDGNHYELLLDGSADKPLGQYQVYYLYYRMPRIQYVKHQSGTLVQVTGADGNITYDGNLLTMNGGTVEQDQRLLLPVNGDLTISQFGNHFRMPPNLDDGESVRYLTYTQLGVGGPGITSLDSLTVGSRLELHLRLHVLQLRERLMANGRRTALEYSFDGNTWTAFDSTGWTGPTPTIYAVYQERGYDLLIGKAVNTSASGAKPIFTQATFTVTIESNAITKNSYDVDGYEEAAIAATPASDTAPGRIVLEDVEDGTSIRFKSLTRGEYTITETKNENYVLTAQSGPIVGNVTQPVPVDDDGSTIHLTLDSEKKLELTNTPRKLCKIMDIGAEHVFYTFADAMDYVDKNIVDYTATVWMLSDYLMPQEDVLQIPAGYRITLKTADSGTYQYEGVQGRATISRSESMADSVLIRNEGELTLDTIVLDGKDVQATAPLIQSSGVGLTVGHYAVLKSAHNTNDGGAIYVNAGNVTISSGTIQECFAGYKLGTQIPEGAAAAKGGAICYLGNGTVTLDHAVVKRNAATGDGGAIYAAQGILVLTNHADVKSNTAGGNGGAIYAGNLDITVEDGASMTGNEAQSGGAIYAETATIQVQKGDEEAPSISSNKALATDGNGGAIFLAQGSVSAAGVTMTGNTAASGNGGAIYAGSAAVSLSDNSSLLAGNEAKSGGAVYAQSGTVALSGGSMSRNTASDGNGGAIYAGSGAVSLTAGSSIKGNTAASGDSGEGSGGAIYAQSGMVTVSSSTIGAVDTTDDASADGNRADSGGAIFVGSGAVTITDSNLNWNVAETTGGAIYALAGNVILNKTESGSLSLGRNEAMAGNGGAIYAYGGNVSVSGGDVIGNTSGGKGGVVYAASGTVALIGVSVTNNVAGGDGGVICTASNGGVTVTDCAAVTSNKSTGGKGGVICTESGGVTISGSTFGGDGEGAGNSSVSGGVLYTESGTVSVTGGSMTKNKATSGNGGAVCTASGSVTAAGVTMTGNTAASGNGGAIYAENGTVSVTSGTVNGATTNSNLNANSAKNGGALYIGSGTANLNTVTMAGNTATESGGAAYSDSGNLTLAGGSMTKNTADNFGGVVYAGNGTLTVNSAAKLGKESLTNANEAKNGAAIFVNEGTGVISSDNTAIQYNLATSDSGGAVGVGDASARLFFANSVKINNNRQIDSSGIVANVYLDQDSDTVINADNIGNGASVGIYVPGAFDGDLFTHRGAASALFGSYTNISDSNLGRLAKFTNDRNTGLTAQKADNNKIQWVKTIAVEVRYLGTFENSETGFPPAAAGTTLFTLNNYVMPSSLNGTSQIAADIYANYSTNLLKDVYPNAGFACAFKDGETSFGNYLTDVNWNGAEGFWQFIPRGWNPTTEPAPTPITGDKIIIYFSESTYLSLVNNTENSLSLTLTEITVLGKNAVTDGYGYVTAKNGMTVEKLMPIGSDDLTIPAGHSIKFLFPGATNQSFILKGTFGDGVTVTYQVDGTSQGQLSSPFTLEDLTLPSDGETREILFGETGLSICKVEEDDTEWPSLMAAMNHIVDRKSTTGNTTYTIGMLVDYLQPPNDVLNIPNGYDITLTTDSSYSGSGTVGSQKAATLSRDAGNLGAMIKSEQNTIVSDAFHAGFKLENLIMDGRALVGTGDGGALKTKNATVTINNTYFKGFEATNGGALYVDFDTSNTASHAYQKTTGDYLATMTVTNTDFLNCRSSSNEDKTGGGALWTTARVLTLENCHVTGSSCYKDGAAQAGAIFHNINDKRRAAYSTNSHTFIRNCSFKDCYVQKASGGAVESDALDVVVEDCQFDTCYVKAGTKNGGGLNIYANNSEDPNVNSRTTMRNTQFINCSSTNNGGAFRTTSEYVTMENVTFSKCKAKNGGGFAATGKNSKELTINGSSFDSCNANGTGGGGVYTTANEVTIGDYTAGDGTVIHSSFTNCQSTNEGGGIYQNRDNSIFSMTNAVVNGNVSTGKAGGGIYTKAKEVKLDGGVISNNTAKTYGGGICQYNDLTKYQVNEFTMNGTAISGNKATDNYGGGIHTVAKVVSLTGGSLTNNTAKQTGGGLHTNAQTSLTIKGTQIKKNTATGDGGGVYYDGADDTKRAGMTLTLKGCSIENNTSGAAGGGVFTQVKTVEIKDFASISYNTAQNGGGVYHRLFTDAALTVEDASINGNKANGSNNKNGFGGGLRTNAKTLTITDSSISNNTASNHGGGLWYDGADNSARLEMSVTVSGGNIDGNTSGVNGGGVYTLVKTVEIKDSASISYNTAQNGGGIFHSLNEEGTRLTVTGGSIDGNWANGTGDNGLGGGVYTNVRSMTAKGASFSNNTSANHGGGIYDVNWNKDTLGAHLYPGMYLTLQGCKLENNTSGVNGGGVYTIVGTLTIQDNSDDSNEATKHTVIKDCRASGDGGGVCHAQTDDALTTTLEYCTISGCSAGGASGGGGLLTRAGKVTVRGAVIRNNTASAGNGGGISYPYYRSATWTANAQDATKWDINTEKGLKLEQTIISGNTASAKGGGVYSSSYVWMLHDSAITGNRLSSPTYGNAAGMYLENNMTLIVGDPDFSSDPTKDENDTINIKENYTISGAASNLRLWSDPSTGLNNERSVYVFCHLNTESSVRVVNAYTVSTKFGYSNVPNPLGFTQGFTSDSAVFRADHDTLYGIIDRSQGNYQSIIWAGPAICKITDGSGTLLYLRRNSDGNGADPAIFDRLDIDGETGITSAFSVLRGENDLTYPDGSSTGFTGPELYYSNGNPYTGSEYCVKMLDSFTTENGIRIYYKAGRTITLTTASRDPSVEGEYYYEYSKTVKTKGDTAKVLRGSGVGATNAMVYTQGSLVVSNIILDGGSLEPGFSAGQKTRLINATGFGNQIDVTLIDGAILQNARTNHTDGNGAGVYLGRNARLTIGNEETSGVIKNCCAPNGGAVYAESNSLGIEFVRGNIVQCEADNNGGGVYQGGGSFIMSGGTIDRCTAGHDGGGVFVANGKTFEMTGTSRITGNHAENSGGGIAVGGENAKLEFSVKPTVKGNTSSISDAVGKVCNVQLDWPNNGIINTVEKTWNGITYKGLANGASIGVYVSGTKDDQTPDNNTEPYRSHGVERTPFGTYQEGNNEKTFYSFVNDRNGLKGGLIANTGDHYIYWVKIFSLEVSMTGYDVAATGHKIPDNETFTFKVQLTGEADVEGQPDAQDIDGDDYGGMTFQSNGVDSTTATVELKLGDNDTWESGVSCTAENLSAGLTYTITPMLTEAQKKQYVSIPAQYSGEIGENNKDGVDVAESERYISRAPFQIVLAVCKLTNHNGGLLYYARDNAKSGDAHIPAVFASLEDAAVALTAKQLYYGVNYNDSSFILGIGAEGAQIQMLVETCKQLSSVSIPTNSAVTLKTASLEAVGNDVYTYRGTNGTTATIQRGFGDDADGNESMFVANGHLTVDNITLDGSKTTYNGDAIVTGNGGIVQVTSGGKLTLDHETSCLQNSGVKGNGGAVYVAAGGEADIKAGKVKQNEATCGGAVFVEAGGKAAMTGGSVEDNKYVKDGTSGNGAGFYLAEGSTLELSGSPGFGSSLTGWGDISDKKSNIGSSMSSQTNGKKEYLVEHQDVYIAETAAGPALVLKDNLTGTAGSIWVWAENQERYGMANAFAKVDFDSATITDTTYHIFRNAQTDARTFVSDINYLTGDKEREKDGFIHWTGGYDVIFKKVDGFGNALSGAVFTLYTDSECTPTTVYKRNGIDVSATSAVGSEQTSSNVTIDKGLVLIEKLPAGVYYMKETTVPTGFANSQVYILLVGQAELSKWRNYGLTQESEITSQTTKYKEDYETKYGIKNSYAVFLYQDGKAVTTPDIAKNGVINIPVAGRKVILRKVSSTYDSLEGAEFQIFRSDGTQVSSGVDASGNPITTFTSTASGVYFIDSLPYGTYYLYEKTAPTKINGTNTTAYSANVGKWYTLTVGSDTTQGNSNEVTVSVITDSSTIEDLNKSFIKS